MTVLKGEENLLLPTCITSPSSSTSIVTGDRGGVSSKSDESELSSPCFLFCLLNFKMAAAGSFLTLMKSTVVVFKHQFSTY